NSSLCSDPAPGNARAISRSSASVVIRLATNRKLNPKKPKLPNPQGSISMSLHVFANVVTPFGTAANNRGDNQGANITPLQKLIWLGEPHTTVSAEAIRFAVRRRLKAAGLPCNRHWAEHLADIPDTVREQLAKAFKGDIKVPCGYFVDPDFAWYADPS